MNVNIYYTKVYKNETAFRRVKNKPNSNPIKACPELAEALSAAEGAVEWANLYSCRYYRIYIYSTRFAALKNNRCYGKFQLENLHFRRLLLMKKLVLMAKRNGVRKPPEILPRYFRLL